MLHSVVFLGAFPVVKSLQRSNQIASDPANPLERLMTEVIGQFHIITIYIDVDTNRLAPILLFRSLDIGIDLSLLQFSTILSSSIFLPCYANVGISASNAMSSIADRITSAAL